MNKNILFVVFAFIASAVLAFFSFSTQTTSASPLYTDPTPTPVIDYWTDSRVSFTWTQGDGANVYLDEMSSPPWCMDSDGESDGCDITAPEGNSPAGVLITLNSKTYNGDSRIHERTNTNFAKKFTDKWGSPYMSAGETICVGTSGGCSSVGYEVDSNSDWEGFVDDDPYDYIEDVRIYTELGSTGSVNFSIQPIWYGVWECIAVEPEEREFISMGLLLGDDDEGETFQLIANHEYVLYTNEGPWNDGTDDRYDIAVRFKTSRYEDPPGGEWGEWTALENVEGEDICNTDFLDANGSALLFEADADTQAQIQFRVNDIDEEFDDNTGDVEYYFLGGEGTSQGCGETWSMVSKVAGHTPPANTSYIYNLSDYYHGGTYDGKIAPGGPYAYKVTGTYLDNGVESNATIVKAGASGEEWTDPNDAFLPTSDQCEAETDGDITYYGTTVSAWNPNLFNVPGKEPYFKINDANVADNTGSITVEWYEAEWTAPASDCATTYTIGTFIESPIFFANNSDGVQYPKAINGLVVGQVYYLESAGVPYYLNGTPSYDFEVGYALDWVGEVQWQDPEAFFDCITDIDQNKKGYYFTATEETFWLRAEYGIGGHGDNTGTVKFNLYGAVPNEVPDGESCSDYFTLDTLRWRGTVGASSTTGYSIDHSVFTPGDRYAIVITGSYTDPDGTGKTAEIRRSSPTSGSVEWADFADWDASLCYEQDDGYDIVYFEASELSDYEVRANTPAGNSGDMEFEVWNLEQIKNTVLGCEYNYADVDAWYIVKMDEVVDANNKGVETDGSGNITAVTGYVLANSFTENELVFKLETGFINDQVTTMPWWDLQISPDGGTTWVFLQDWVDCWVDLGTPEGRGYWTAPVAGGPFLLRVYDVGGIYLDNVGGVQIDMWVSSSNADPGDIWTNPYSKEAWGEGCYGICASPGFFQIGEWIEYARCRLTKWLAWCPEHSQALSDARLAFTQVEPFRTFFEFIDLFGAVRAEVESYSWTDDEGGSADAYFIQSPPNWILVPGEGGGAGIDDSPLTGPDSIWGSGDIDLTPDDSVSFRTDCDNDLADVVGTRLATPLCFSMNVVDQLGMRYWFQFIWNIMVSFAFALYLKKNWVDKLQ